MTTKMYPFSKANFAILRKYADKLNEQSIIAENIGDFESSEKLFAESVRIYGIGTDEFGVRTKDGCVWLTGKEIGEAKKILAMA